MSKLWSIISQQRHHVYILNVNPIIGFEWNSNLKLTRRTACLHERAWRGSASDFLVFRLLQSLNLVSAWLSFVVLQHKTVWVNCWQLLGIFSLTDTNFPKLEKRSMEAVFFKTFWNGLIFSIQSKYDVVSHPFYAWNLMILSPTLLLES